MKTVSENRAFGGVQGVYTHASQSTGCDMTFGLFLPQQAEEGPVPLLWFLSGLTCTHENAMIKAGAQRWAAEAGIALCFPDTSPRGEGVANDLDFALGQGAGFYVNATQKPWAPHFRMWDYITEELPRVLFNAFPLAEEAQGITGHSMGGHGALICALKEPGLYRSVSAFAPICHPMACGWGQGCFKAYLGNDRETWVAYDAVRLIEEGAPAIPLLIDQGADDEFLAQQLHPMSLERVCAARQFPLTLRWQDGYDHSYHFIATFIGEHLAYHAAELR